MFCLQVVKEKPSIYLGFVLTFSMYGSRLLVFSRSEKCFLCKCQLMSIVFLTVGCLPGLVQMKEPTFAGGPSSRHTESTLTRPDQKQIGQLDQLSVKSVSEEIYTSVLLMINYLFFFSPPPVGQMNAELSSLALSEQGAFRRWYRMQVKSCISAG